MIITYDDLFAVMYKEVVEEIARYDEGVIRRAMQNAEDEVKLYITRYDIIALLGDDNTEPTVDSPLLRKYCANIACWNLACLANPNINYDHIRFLYDRTIEQLKMIQKQQAQPAGWPYRDTTGQTAPEGSSVSFTSFPKRSNNF